MSVKQFDLAEGARLVMLEAGFLPELPPAAQREAAALRPASPEGPGVRDLRSLLWSSIDNDDSRDLDQIEVAERLPQRPRARARGDRRRRRARPPRSAIDEYAVAQHVHGLHGRADLPDAPGVALDRPHVARRRRSTGSRSSWRWTSTREGVDRALGRLPRGREEPRQARVRRRRRVARGDGARAGEGGGERRAAGAAPPAGRAPRRR